MEDEIIRSAASEIVTEFLFDTCTILPQPTKYDLQAATICARMATRHPESRANVDDNVPMISGSVAEFYIEPMLPCIGDVDVMFHRNSKLAIPRGHPPPTQLPDEFNDYLNVLAIVDSQFPGYVYLDLYYYLEYCTDDDKYYIRHRNSGNALFSVGYNDELMRYKHGPALTTDKYYTPLLSIDIVRCVRCLPWPTQAADWPTRHRNYDWPDSATVDRVVNNGFDVVHVAHHQCGQPEWMSEGQRQWRLSFSRAEIVLVNSWMPVQYSYEFS